jgi:hydroxyacylglutathione hydrolase
MRFRTRMLVFATSAALPALVAAQTNPPAAPAASAAPAIVIERVALDELKKLMEADKVVVLDVRPAEAYRDAHIPGSLSAPLAEIDKHVEKLKAAKKPIVTYCT